MIQRLFFFLTCLALVTIACKSGNQEAADQTTTDTTAVKETTAVVDTTANAATANHQMTGTTSNTGTNHAAGSTTAPLTDDKGFYLHPAKEPVYPGGQVAFNKYLTDNLRYPSDARENNIQGTVQATLSVDEHGKIVNVEIVSKPLGYGLEEEVIRVIKGMPQWSPAQHENHAVKSKYTVPVVFKLK